MTLLCALIHTLCVTGNLCNQFLQIDFEVGVRSDARAACEMTCNSRKSSRGSQDDNGDTAQCVASTVSCERHKLVFADSFQGHAAFACLRCSQEELQRGAFRTSPSRFFNFLSSNKLVVCSELSTLICGQL